MKRIAYNSYGGPDVMYVEDFTPSAPGPGEVAVTVRAASINPVDWKIRLGYMAQMTGDAFPRALGSEFAGVIAQVGAGVTDFAPGDEVVGTTSFAAQGSFAEAVTTTTTLLAKKPPELSFVDATGVGLVGVTAWLALVQVAGLRAGQTVLINGALGGVGQAAVTLANSIGAVVTARVSATGFAEAEALGVARVLDYAQAVPDALNGTFDVVFDVNGGFSVADTDALVKPAGIVVHINPDEAKIGAVTTAAARHKLVIAEGTRANFEAVLALAAKRELRVPVNQVRPFAEAIPLITALEGGQRVSGKSVITFG